MKTLQLTKSSCYHLLSYFHSPHLTRQSKPDNNPPKKGQGLNHRLYIKMDDMAVPWLYNEAKNGRLPGSKKTRIRGCSSALLLHHAAHRASALETLLLLFRSCVTSVETKPEVAGTCGLALC